MNKLLLRIILDAVLFFSIFLLPWWFSLFLGFACVFLFKNFFEALLVGFVLDALYGIAGQTFFKTNMLFTFLSAAVLAFSYLARKRLSFYSS